MSKNIQRLIIPLVIISMFSWNIDSALAQTTSRKVRLFEGFKIKFISGKIKLVHITVAGGGSDLPTVTTNATPNDSGQDIGFNWLLLEGNITAIGGSSPTVRGFAWQINVPSLSGAATTTEAGSFGVGTYFSVCADNIGSETITDVIYFRAYATNAQGTGYGTIESAALNSTLKTCPTGA